MWFNITVKQFIIFIQRTTYLRESDLQVKELKMSDKDRSLKYKNYLKYLDNKKEDLGASAQQMYEQTFKLLPSDELKRPKNNCTRCHGRGYEGTKIVNDVRVAVVCSCHFVNNNKPVFVH